MEGARNVCLDTVKRGEYDSFGESVNLDDKSVTTTVVLRLYEAFGGHAQVRLIVSGHLPVLKAFTTNLLEDEDEALYILRSSDPADCSGSTLSLSFRGFEVKTIKLVLGTLPPNPSHKQVSVHHSRSTDLTAQLTHPPFS